MAQNIYHSYYVIRNTDSFQQISGTVEIGVEMTDWEYFAE